MIRGWATPHRGLATDWHRWYTDPPEADRLGLDAARSAGAGEVEEEGVGDVKILTLSDKVVLG